jgi:predicted PurR-regulated permease PerM
MKTATDVPPQPQPTARYVLTGLALLACGLMLWPFLPGVAAGVAAAAVCLPLHRRLVRATGDRPGLAAGLTVVAAVLVLVIPLVLVSAQLTAEARRGVEVVREKAADGDLRDLAGRVPVAGPYLIDWLDKVYAGEVSLEREARAAVARIGQTSLGFAYGAASAAIQLLIAGFVLFFTLKDHPHLLAAAKRLFPLPDRRAAHVITRMDDAVQATVYGTLLTGLIQGVSGGLVFWALGLPAPVLWGVVMTVLSVLPVLGAFIVWVPAAVWLGATGQVWQAAVLTAWGVLMAGPVCNSIYAVTAGDRMKMHPMPALLAFVGGLAVFGIAGMVIGPAVLALAVGLLEEQGVDALTGERRG